MLAEPLVMVATLFSLSLWFNQTLDEKYYLIAILIFAIGFPGTWYEEESKIQQLFNILSDWMFVVIVVLFIEYSTTYLKDFPKQMVTMWLLVTPLMISIVHVIFGYYINSQLYRESITRHALIIGVNILGLRLKHMMESEPNLALRFHGFFDDRDPVRLKEEIGFDGALLGKLNDVYAYAKTHHIDVIYIALPMSQQPRMVELLDSLKDTTVSVYFVPDIFVFDLIQARIDDVGGIPVVAVCESPFSGINGVIKKVSDYLFASAILILISPIMAVIALLVKLSSPGPVIYKQKRYGLDAEEITVYKFRSMTFVENADEVTQATRFDERVTPIGKILRKTSMDELPQFFNVLQGRMSIVGPRPHAVAHNEMYRKMIKGYMVRHKVKPGITGWAQVNGLRGETETIDKMETRLQYDLDYLRQWSLVLDIKIILRTVWLVFKDQHAY